MLKLKKIFGMGNCGSNTEPEPVIGKLDAVSDILVGLKENRVGDKKKGDIERVVDFASQHQGPLFLEFKRNDLT